MASEKEKLIAKSGLIGLVGQAVTLLISVITTRLFIHCLGVEIRGVYGVLANCMSYLQLSELGVGSAITYHLYKPIKENNHDEICEWVHLYKIILRIVAGAILVLGIIMSVFLPVIVKETTLSDRELYFYFAMILVSTVCTYFGAHKKCLMYADQKQYILSGIDIIANVIVSVIQIVTLVKFKSFAGYLLLQVLKNLGISLFIILKANRLYGYINKKCSLDKGKFRELVSNIKYIFAGEISTVIYLSTDNLIVSGVVGVAAVGYLANYAQLKSVLKSLVVGVTTPIKPVLAELAQSSDDKRLLHAALKKYNLFRFVVANIASIGFIGVSGGIIRIWLGEQYVMGTAVVVLMAADLYIDIINSSLCDMISIYGLFRYDRNIAMAGAIINVVFSLVLAFVIGLKGVLIGTILAQMFYWSARTYVTYRFIIPKAGKMYVLASIKEILLTVVEAIIILMVGEMVDTVSSVLHVLIMIPTALLISGMGVLLFYGRSEDFRYYTKKCKELVMKKE